MLSKSKSKLELKKEMQTLPLLDPPRHVRLKFCKVGTLQYISHLDLQRTFNRILVRSCIPVWYTQGFNPHIKLVFSTPLSVGSQSVCEYLDIRLSREMSYDEIKERLNAEMTEEFYITDVYEAKTDFSEIAYASYEIALHTPKGSCEVAQSLATDFLATPIYMVKKGKAGEREIDIVPLIKAIGAEYDAQSGDLKVKTILSASSSQYLNPEMLIKAIDDRYELFSEALTEEYYSILRTSLKKADLSEFF